MITGICKKMKSCMLLKFGWASQLFGQLILIYCFATSADERLRETLPSEWTAWWSEIIELLEYAALYSPTVAKDLELASLLHNTPGSAALTVQMNTS
jgi:hypothetical protein